ncbi:MAG: putative Ig domain-containing protein [Candidatus Woesearchaeota archaeon]
MRLCAFGLICLLMIPGAFALVSPHGITGKVLELDGLTQVRGTTYFTVNNTNNGFFLSGMVGRGQSTGKYLAALNGKDGDLITIKVSNDYHLASRSIILQGVMHNVDLLLNTTMPINPPQFTSVPITGALEDSLYLYKAFVYDPDLDTIEYSLSTAPASMQVNSTSGLISWLPTGNDVGSHTIVVKADDGIFSVNQSFVLIVQNVNDPPIISSSPIITATEDYPYFYQLNASDEDSASLSYLLVVGPKGMFIDQASGLLRWIPTNSDIGINPVRLLVDDSDGGQAFQDFNITVAPVDDPPVFISIPDISSTQGYPYSYQVQVIDEENDELFFSLASSPEGMSISQSGLVIFTPSSSQVGSFFVSIIVSESAHTISQNYTLFVEDVNDAPIITSIPMLVAVQGSNYKYMVLAFDPDQDNLSYSLGTAPATMQIDSKTGLINWTPANDDVGLHNITVFVSDYNSSAMQSFVLTVLNVNDAPRIVSAPVLSATQGVSYSYQVIASDIDNDPLSFSLLSSPKGMTIDSSTGLIIWTPTAWQVSSYNITVVVSDGLLTDQQSFVLYVQNVNDAPTITSEPITIANVGVQYTYQVNSTDFDHDILTYSLLAKPSTMSIEPLTGLITWLPKHKDRGLHYITVMVNDSSLVSVQTYPLVVLDDNSCRKSCYEVSDAILQVSATAYSSCKTIASDDLDSCSKSCAGCSSCKQSYFSSLHSCSSSYKTSLSGADEVEQSCLDACIGESLNLQSYSYSVDNTSIISLDVLSSQKPLTEVRELDSRPLDSSPPGATVFKYLAIDQIDDASISSANITFYVERLWLVEHGLIASDIVLTHFHNNTWIVLPTILLYSDESRFYYRATTPSFSYFAIASSHLSPKISDVSTSRLIRVPIVMSGILFAPDSTELPRGTHFVIFNRNSNKTVEAFTGGPSPGAFFILVEGNPGDELVFSVEGFPDAILASPGDVDLGKFRLDPVNNKVVLEMQKVSSEVPQPAADVVSEVVSSVKSMNPVFSLVVLCASFLAVYAFVRFRRKND